MIDENSSVFFNNIDKDDFFNQENVSPNNKQSFNIQSVDTKISSLKTNNEKREIPDLGRKPFGLMPHKLKLTINVQDSWAEKKARINSNGSIPMIDPKVLSFLGVKSIPETMTLQECLSAEEMLLSKKAVGIGSFGSAYEIISQSRSPLIFKIEKAPKLVPEKKFWRHSDFSPTRLDLPYLVKPLSYLVSVETADGRTERFYLPSSKTKEFGQALPPDAQVKIEGQLMEKAPGANLYRLAMEKTISFFPGGPHFKNIFIALNKFLQESYKHNFIHRDLKPENIIYDPESGTVTIIDTGESSRLRSRGKSDEQIKQGSLSNPLKSTRRQGTRNFMAPTITKGVEYASEVDFFSASMLLLRLICEEDFNSFTKERFPSPITDELVDIAPQNILNFYLEKAGPESTTVKILSNFPQLQTVLNLYFQISAGGSLDAHELSEQAFQELKNFLDSNSLEFLNPLD